MLKLRSRGFDRAQYYLAYIWWNMLIEFSKQIGKSLAKIIKTKENSRPC